MIACKLPGVANPLFALGILGGLGYVVYDALKGKKAPAAPSSSAGGAVDSDVNLETMKVDSIDLQWPEGIALPPIDPADVVSIPIPGLGGVEIPPVGEIPWDLPPGFDPLPKPKACNEGFVPTGRPVDDVTTLAKTCVPSYDTLKRIVRTFKEGERVTLDFGAAYRHGVRAFAVGDEGLVDVNMWVTDPQGNVLISDTQSGVAPSVGFAVDDQDQVGSKSGVMLKLVVEATAGIGEIAIGIFGEPHCHKGFVRSGVAMADVLALAERCAGDMKPLGQPIAYPFKAGEVRSVPIVLQAGVAYRIIGAGDKGVTDCDLEIRDANGSLIVADLTPNDAIPIVMPSVRFHVAKTGPYTLRIACKKGSGEIAVGIWSAP